MKRVLFAVLPLLCLLCVNCRTQKSYKETRQKKVTIQHVVVDPPRFSTDSVFKIDSLVQPKTQTFEDTSSTIRVTVTPVRFDKETGQATDIKIEATADPPPVVKPCPPCEQEFVEIIKEKKVTVWPWWLYAGIVVLLLSVFYNFYQRFSLL